jgi:putative addiction module component (TIGR02574 family)
MAANEEAVMAGSTLEKVRTEALRLSEAERAELAHGLVESLDGPADTDAESAWDAEIVRRLAEIDAGTAKLIDREEMRRRMRARMNRCARRRGRRQGRGAATC